MDLATDSSSEYDKGKKKIGPQTRDHNSVKILVDFHIFFTGRFLGKFAVKWILKFPPHLAAPTLPCETLMSAKQAINDKLQRSCAFIFKVWWGC